MSRRSRVGRLARGITPYLPLAVAAAGWPMAVSQTDLGAVSDLGLISAIPAALVFVSVLLVAGFVAAVRRDATGAAFMHLVALVAVIHGTVPLADGPAHGSATYVHAGITEAIIRTGDLFPELDARFDWPGFFLLTAVAAELSGVRPLDAAPWVPLALNLAYLVPLALAMTATGFSRSERWFGALLFVIANWVGQDYLSPQGLNYLLFLFAISIWLTVFLRPVSSTRGQTAVARHRPWDRAAWALIVVAICAASIVSHQLTPFAMLLVSVGLLGRLRFELPWMVPLLALGIGGWLAYPAVTYVAGHLPELIADIGSTEEFATRNVAERVGGSPGHVAVVITRLMFTAGIWLVAALGVVQLWRERRLTVEAVVTAAAPFPLLALQPYGGEMLLRVYLFSLPFVAAFVSVPVARSARVVKGWGTFLMLVAVLGVFTVARFGNLRAEAFSEAEVQAARHLYEVTPIESSVVVINGNAPIKFERFELLSHVAIGSSVFDDAAPVSTQARRLAGDTESFLFVSRGQQAYEELFSGRTERDWEALVARMNADAGLTLLFENAAASIYRVD